MSKRFQEISSRGLLGIGKKYPKLLYSFLTLANEIMCSPGSLSKLQREILGAYLSMRFGCDFCHFGHLDTVEALAGKEARDRVKNPNSQDRVLFEFAEKVVSNTVADSDISKLIQSGLDEEAIHQIIFVSALFGFANRMVTGFGIDYLEERDRSTSMALAHGYLLGK